MHTNTQHNTSGKEHYLLLHNSPVHSMPHQWQLKPCDLAYFFVTTGLPTTLTCYKVASQSSKRHAGGNVPFFFFNQINTFTRQLILSIENLVLSHFLYLQNRENHTAAEQRNFHSSVSFVEFTKCGLQVRNLHRNVKC